MKRWTMALLLFELILFAIILILPQVELPEFAFRAGAAPVLAKASVTAPPASLSLEATTTIPLPEHVLRPLPGEEELLTTARSESQLIRLCALLC